MRVKHRHGRKLSALALGLLCLASVAHGRILGDEAVGSAAIESLAAESALFESLQKGIALSLAQCEFDAACTPNVRRQELQRIVDALGLRVSSLGVRYEEGGEAALEPILRRYLESLEAYSGFIERLAIIAPEPVLEEAEMEEDVFARQFGRVANIRQLYGVFEDVDEEILDDEGAEEFEQDEPAAAEPPAAQEQEPIQE